MAKAAVAEQHAAEERAEHLDFNDHSSNHSWGASAQSLDGFGRKDMPVPAASNGNSWARELHNERPQGLRDSDVYSH